LKVSKIIMHFVVMALCFLKHLLYKLELGGP